MLLAQEQEKNSRTTQRRSSRKYRASIGGDSRCNHLINGRSLWLCATSNTPFHRSHSDPWTDVSHQVSVYPVDDACIDISHLEQRWNLWVPGTTINPNHVSHAPSTIRVSDDHAHAWFDVQENGIRFGRSNGACMINRHTLRASTSVLVQEWVWGPGNESEDCAIVLGSAMGATTSRNF